MGGGGGGVAIPLHIRQLIYQKVLLNTTAAADIFMELFKLCFIRLFEIDLFSSYS